MLSWNEILKDRKTFKSGLVVGKFQPPHNGHHYLIDQAMERCEMTFVLVVDTEVSNSLVSPLQQLEILSEVHPGAIVKTMPDILQDNNSEYWAEYTKEFLGFTPNVVFTSEDYGEPWAEALGCEHVCVDPERTTYPVSATMVRTDPLEMKGMVASVTWAHLVKRVVVIGAESTGTTTLANDLADHYETNVVLEFGRLRDERKVERDGEPYDWPSEDFLYTARVQQAMEDRLARTANRVLICDTDAIATYLWEGRYLGSFNHKILDIADEHFHKHDLYIVTSPHGVEPEEDGLRFEMEKREDMHKSFLTILENHRLPYIVVEGNPQQRVNQSVEAIDKIID